MQVTVPAALRKRYSRVIGWSFLMILSALPGQDLHHLDGFFEFVGSEAITNTGTAIAVRSVKPDSEYDFQMGYDRFDIDYRPNPFSAGIGVPVNLIEDQFRIAASLTRSIHEDFETTLSANYRDGYSDYRSVWINEYYYQLFSGFDEYIQADPESFGGSVELAWANAPRSLNFDIAANISQERIAPGYERILGPDGGLERDESVLNSYGMTGGFEHLLSSRMRARHELGWLAVSSRSTRVFYKGQVKWAIKRDWVSHSEASYTFEGSTFRAWSLGTSIEKDWDERWFAGFTLRYYEDNGQIEDSLATASSAAPPLVTMRATLRIRYVNEGFSMQIYGGPYQTNYGVLDREIAPFVNLYRDRDWLMLGARASYKF